MKNQRGFSHILIILILSISAIVGFLVYTKNRKVEQEMVYKNADYGFQFNYENGGVVYEGSNDAVRPEYEYSVQISYRDETDSGLYYVIFTKNSNCSVEVWTKPSNATVKDIVISNQKAMLQEQDGAYDHFYKTACLDNVNGAFVFSTDYPIKASEEAKQRSERRFEKITNSFKLLMEETSNTKSYAGWTDYENGKYGFRLKYPADLGVVSIEEYDVQARHREYIRKCESGEYQGCGGLRQPEYQIWFLDSERWPLFMVDIHVVPAAKSLGGKENAEGFTYMVKPSDIDGPEMPKITSGLINDIQNSLDFIHTEMSLGCLWTGEFIGVETSDQSIYKQSSGFYYNQKDKKCAPVSIWYPKNDDPKIPFVDLGVCTTICAR